MKPNRSIVITGGGGMLAQALSKTLAGRGESAVLLNRAACDISRPQDVQKLFDSHRPTLVLNCAAHTKVDLCEEQEDQANGINGRGVGHLAALAKERDVPLVHYSTDFVFDGQGTRPYRAEDPTHPISAYGRSKLLGERLLLQTAPSQGLIIRTAWLYGPGGPCFPQTMINAARAGKSLKVVADQTGAPTFTHDLAEATLALLDRGARGVWHVTNSGQTTWFDFTAAILEEFGLRAELSPTTSAEWKKLKPASAPRPTYSVLDIEPFARLTGRPMRPWREALSAYRAALEQATA